MTPRRGPTPDPDYPGGAHGPRCGVRGQVWVLLRGGARHLDCYDDVEDR